MKLITPKSININDEIGGKAKNLLLLNKLGVSVPKWTVIPENVLVNQLPQKSLESFKKTIPELEVSVDIIDQLKDK